jgi:hypothetical protein
VPVWDSMTRFAPSPFNRERPVMITDEAPRLTKCMAVARPRPEVAPVMRIPWLLKVPGSGSEGRENLLL